MKRKRKAMVQSAEQTKCCPFCNSDVNDELMYGEIHPTYKLNAHYFCLLFSSGLNQRGRDNQGIYGFMLKDIEKELNRGKRLLCSYCKKGGATIGCGVRGCAKKFHLPCGRQNGSLHQFFGCFESYCNQHKPTQNKIQINEGEDICVICHDFLVSSSTKDVLSSTCCVNSKYHYNCLQNYAIHAGEIHFRCPKCQNVDKFKKEMLNFGVYIPDQDASWEREENAYQELLVRHDECDYLKCICPKGRNYQDDRQWSLVLCKCCGSQGCHAACGKIPVKKPSWVCRECYSVVCKNKASIVASSSSNTSSFTSDSRNNQLHIKPCIVVLKQLPSGITDGITENSEQLSYEKFIQNMNSGVAEKDNSESEDVDILTFDSDVEITEEKTTLPVRNSNVIDSEDDDIVIVKVVEHQPSLRGETSIEKGTDLISENNNIFDIDDESFENLEYIKAIKSMIDTFKCVDVDEINIEDLLSDKQTLGVDHVQLPVPCPTRASAEEDLNEIIVEKEKLNGRAENRKKRKYRNKLQNEENTKPNSLGRTKCKSSSNNGNYVDDGDSGSSAPKVLKTMVKQNGEFSVKTDYVGDGRKRYNRESPATRSTDLTERRVRKNSKKEKFTNRSENLQKNMHVNQRRCKNSSFTRYSMTEAESQTISSLIEGKVDEIINICNESSFINSSCDSEEVAQGSGFLLTGTREEYSQDNSLNELSKCKSKNGERNSRSSIKGEKKNKRKYKYKKIDVPNEMKISKISKLCKDCNVCDNLKSHFHSLKMGE